MFLWSIPDFCLSRKLSGTCSISAFHNFIDLLSRADPPRARFSSRRRQFFDIPQRANVNSDNDIITASVICWSFYPKLLIRDGKGFRSCANNQSISLHPSSVNKGHPELKWLSFYHIMQSKQYVKIGERQYRRLTAVRFYNAHETTAVEEFSIALLCGDVRCDVSCILITSFMLDLTTSRCMLAFSS